jgi:hypothetical protein
MMVEWKADQEKREAERKVDQEEVTKIEAVHNKTVINQMRVEPEMEH